MFQLFLEPLSPPRVELGRLVELSRLCRHCGSLILKSDRLGNLEGECHACRGDRS